MFEFLLPTPFSTIWSKNICLSCLKISGMGPLVRWGPLVRLGSCVTWTSHGFDPRSTNCARWCEDSTRGILAWKRCEDPNKLGGQKPCSFFLEPKNQQGKKKEALGKCSILFNEWSVDGFVFWHGRFVPIEIEGRYPEWRVGSTKSLSIHAYSFESFISNTTITYPKTFDTQNLPLQHFHTSGRFHQRFPPLLPKKVPKNRAPAHEARTWQLYFWHFFSAKKSC